jgi:hypothetical protein
MRNRFLGQEIWPRVGLPPDVAVYVENSEVMRNFRSFLFMRIVPILREIGLWGPRVRGAFEDMGVLGFADADLDTEMANDEAAAEEFDAQMAHVQAVASS